MLELPDRAVATVLIRHARASRRLRFEIDSLLGNPELARTIEQQARTRPGVARVTANPRTGRVLVEYAPAAPVLRQLEQLVRKPPQVPARRATQLANGWHALAIDTVE